MSKKNPNRIFTLILLFEILLIFGLSAALGYYLVLEAYNAYKTDCHNSAVYFDAVEQTLPKFAPLNEKVLAEFKNPDGTFPRKLFNTPNSLTISNCWWVSEKANVYYNVSLTAYYKILDPSKEAQNKVINYYKDLLTTQSWQQDLQREGTGSEKGITYSYVYHRGTTCVSISFDLHEWEDAGEYSGYSLSIWHDLWAQSFSATKPPDAHLWNFHYDPCPPLAK